mmetsp:Transcript_8980/g.22739  ORF Transcript_8980/g.22739 Transcript_8980/m.22739 type:complete len:369 (+) Transcript_8980:93-1199(+)
MRCARASRPLAGPGTSRPSRRRSRPTVRWTRSERARRRARTCRRRWKRCSTSPAAPTSGTRPWGRRGVPSARDRAPGSRTRARRRAGAPSTTAARKAEGVLDIPRAPRRVPSTTAATPLKPAAKTRTETTSPNPTSSRSHPSTPSFAACPTDRTWPVPTTTTTTTLIRPRPTRRSSPISATSAAPAPTRRASSSARPRRKLGRADLDENPGRCDSNSNSATSSAAAMTIPNSVRRPPTIPTAPAPGIRTAPTPGNGAYGDPFSTTHWRTMLSRRHALLPAHEFEFERTWVYYPRLSRAVKPPRLGHRQPTKGLPLHRAALVPCPTSPSSAACGAAAAAAASSDDAHFPGSTSLPPTVLLRRPAAITVM